MLRAHAILALFYAHCPSSFAISVVSCDFVFDCMQILRAVKAWVLELMKFIATLSHVTNVNCLNRTDDRMCRERNPILIHVQRKCVKLTL